MAKRKDSVALFEVITATRKREESTSAARSALRTPKWWFKNKNKAAGAVQTPSEPEQHEYINNTPPQGVAQLPPQLTAPIDPTESVTAATLSSYTPTPTAAVVQRMVPVEYASPAPERVNIPERGDSGAGGTVDPFGLDAPTARAGQSSTTSRQRPWMRLGAKPLGIDPNRREVTVRLRYTTAIIVGFACCVAVGLAYVTGRSTNRAVADPNAVTTENIKKGPILPGVLEVTGITTLDQPDSPANRGGSDDTTGGTSIARGKLGAGTPGGTTAKPVRPTGDVEENAQRTIGLNYVIAQSYRTEKEALAAKEALTKAGIPCTIERGLKGWENVISVVGIKGFQRVRSTEYQSYVQSIENAGSKTKPFDPMGYRWR